ncbi:MAG TPA: bifunctional ADP-heptose synthase [Bacteroidales bacterium]|nr:bifunctional ADP-heptose synthase [Bacteroidales bacterium]
MDKNIEKIFEKFNNLKVLIIGDVMLDSYLWGKVERISPEAPVPIVAVKRRESRPGGAANVALNIASLGAKPYLCSVIGDDIRGNEFLTMLQKLNLNANGIICSKERITTTKFRIIGNNVQMLRVDEEIDTSLSMADKELLKNKINDFCINNKPDVIIFQDYNKGVIDEELIYYVVNKANSLNIPVAVDPKRRNFHFYKGIKLFKPNLKELKEGINVNDEILDIKIIQDKIIEFQKAQNIDILLITLSEQGIYLSYKKEYDEYINVHLPAHLRDIADVSGAGDTVVSLAALCIALQIEPVLLAELSNLAGGIVCEKVGVVPIEKDLLLEEAKKYCLNFKNSF